MKILYSNFFPPKNFSAINIVGIIVARREYGKLSPTDLNHEKIHTCQVFEMLVIFFYLFYGIEWLIRLIQYRNRMTAYENISFEREAYKQMHDLNYLKKRKPFAFIHYYKNKI